MIHVARVHARQVLSASSFSFPDEFLPVDGRRPFTFDRPCTRSLENAMISDPNIPETGEQAARALHNSDDSECCFEVCAEDEPVMGICANCEEPWKHGRLYDPWSAPQCDTALQSDPTGKLDESRLGEIKIND